MNHKKVFSIFTCWNYQKPHPTSGSRFARLQHQNSFWELHSLFLEAANYRTYNYQRLQISIFSGIGF